MSPRSIRNWMLVLVALALTGVVALKLSPPETETWLPYGGRGRVSQLLLELMGGPKGIASIQVPDGFTVEQAAGEDLVRYGVFFSFDDRGRLFVCESAGKNTTDEVAVSDPSFRISILEDTDGDGVFDKSNVFADRITMALGAQWHRGSLYVAAPPDLLRFDDTDNDGVADHREVILSGWPDEIQSGVSVVSSATTLHGPYLGPDGWMYLTYGSSQPYKVKTKEGGILEGRGRVFRTRPDGTGLEWFVGGGFANPVEIAFTPSGDTIGTMTYYSTPKNGVRDALLHYIDGGVYPMWKPYVDTAYQRTGDLLPAVTKFARLAPSGLTRYRGNAFGVEYQGNLFSAQFNPHRIQRHILHREGATYRTDDQDFLTSTDIDLHFTDVLEDADGSLLVLDTGGWYLLNCPVSRIAKSEFKGAVYRVRKKDAEAAADPWGKRIEFDDLSPGELAALLSDERPRVRGRAFDRLIETGSSAAGALKQVRESQAPLEARVLAVFALGRIGGAAAAAAAQAALGDSDLDVRVAAARMAGLNGTKAAVGGLLQMLQSDEAAGRRQAAEALGRIGDVGAVEALLAVSAQPADRFVEHALIYALIRLRDPEPLVSALKDNSPAVRKAALIALDQMEDSPLRREQVVSLLDARDEGLGDAVLWVVSHHPEWSSGLIDYLRARLEAGDPAPDSLEPVRAALLSFAADAGVQRMIARLLAAPSTSAERKLFLLDTIDESSLDELPPVWLTEMRALVRGTHLAIRRKVIAIVASRRIAGMDDELNRLAADTNESEDLRTAALAALVARRPGLSEPSFLFLLGLLRPGTDATLRFSAAHALSKGGLNPEQRLFVASEYLPKAGPLVLPTLLEIFREDHEEEMGRQVVAALLEAPGAIGTVAGERLRALLKNFPNQVQADARPLLAHLDQEKQRQAEKLKKLEPLLRAGGDVGRGRNIFFGEKAACSSCHTIGLEGGHVGPDLTAVGAVRPGLDILEAVIFPNASFVPEHEVYRVETAREVYVGVRGESTGDALVIISGPRDRTRIPRKDIVSTELSAVSLMPDGFDQDLTRQELIDLLAFLQGQKSRQDAVFEEGR